MRRLFPTLIAIAALVGLIRLFRFAQQYDPALEAGTAGPGPDISIRLEGATIVSRRKGIQEWFVQADRIDVHRPDYGGLEGYSGVDFHGIKNGRLFRDGKLEARFLASSAIYDQPNGVFNIEGPMRLTSVDGDRMEADTCQWSERADEVRLTEGVRALVQGHKLTSPYVLFSPRKRLVNCPQGGEAVFDQLTARASNLLWDVNKGVVDCRGPVSGERKNMTFSAANARIRLAQVEVRGKKQTRVSFDANNGTAQFRIEGDDFDPEVLR